MADSISVSGGAGGIGAQLDDMRTESAHLAVMTSNLVDQAASAAGIAMDPDLLASAILSPVTAASAEAKIGFATGQMLLYATEAGVTAVFLAGAVAAYEDVDRSLALLADTAANTTTFALGVMAVPLALAGGAVVLADVAAVYIAGYGAEAVDALSQGVERTLANPWLLAVPGLAVSAVAAHTAAAYDPDDAQALVDDTLAAQLDQLNELAGQNAWAVDLIAQGAPGLLTGLTLPLTALLGPLATSAVLTGITGVPWPPLSYEQALQAIIGGGNRLGYLNDGPPIDQDNLFEPPAIVGEPIVAPTSLASLFEGSTQIDTHDAIGDDTDSFARIRITEVPGNPPSFIVQIPSTQAWDPAAGSTPNDVTGDTHAMLGRQTALASAVDAAMREAGITSESPVMLEGFSLGGITAGQMAADPNLDYNITHVVTGGAPVANFAIPSSVQVLSMEFDEDPVARLDGNGNPDAAHWTTVRAPAPFLPTDQGGTIGIAGAHNSDRYAVTAAEVEASGDPSVTAFLESASGYFGGGDPTTTTDYGAQR